MITKGQQMNLRQSSMNKKLTNNKPNFFFYSLYILPELQSEKREEIKDSKKIWKKAAVGCWAGGGDREDLIKDRLCYVISSKRRRPHCSRDVEQLARGCLIACSDPFQASSSGAHTRNGTDVYSCLLGRCLQLLTVAKTTWYSLTPSAVVIQ